MKNQTEVPDHKICQQLFLENPVLKRLQLSQHAIFSGK